MFLLKTSKGAKQFELQGSSVSFERIFKTKGKKNYSQKHTGIRLNCAPRHDWKSISCNNERR